jgi:hypothetical protein
MIQKIYMNESQELIYIWLITFNLQYKDRIF